MISSLQTPIENKVLFFRLQQLIGYLAVYWNKVQNWKRVRRLPVPMVSQNPALRREVISIYKGI